jgi:hypothetical protein
MEEPAAKRLTWHRQRMKTESSYQWWAFGSGWLFVTVVPMVLAAFHHGAAEGAASIGRPYVPMLPSAATAFWFGMTLFVIGQILGVSLTIRETHLDEERYWK